MNIAFEEDLVPEAAVEGLRELRNSVWVLPRVESNALRRLLEEFPPDVAVLNLDPRSALALEGIRSVIPQLKVVGVTDPVDGLEVQPDWVDLVVPRDSDPIFWMLGVFALQQLDGQAEGPRGRMLLSVIDTAHRAFRSMERSKAAPPMVSELRDRLEQSYESLLRLLLDGLEREVEGLAGHSPRVAAWCRKLAIDLGLSDEEREGAVSAGLLHDLGMHLVVPVRALQQRGPLHAGEWQVLRTHPVASAAAIVPLRGTAPMTRAILEHHERLDGTGYPYGKRGDDVSVAARVVTIADTFEAMTHARPHRPAMGAEQAFEHVMEEVRGGRFDPDVSRALGEVLQAA